jgi:hypothetical protein
MSALGHKRTFAVQKGLSGLPPIATAKADSRKWSCPLYSQKRTCAAQMVMSALGQKQTFHLSTNKLPFCVIGYRRSSASMLRMVGRCRAISHQLSPSSRLAKTEPLLVPK